jgi:hypothetical protein
MKIIKGNWYECVSAEGWFGQFEAHLQSTKVLIDLYLKEYETDKKSD